MTFPLESYRSLWVVFLGKKQRQNCKSLWLTNQGTSKSMKSLLFFFWESSKSMKSITLSNSHYTTLWISNFMVWLELLLVEFICFTYSMWLSIFSTFSFNSIMFKTITKLFTNSWLRKQVPLKPLICVYHCSQHRFKVGILWKQCKLTF